MTLWLKAIIALRFSYTVTSSDCFVRMLCVGNAFVMLLRLIKVVGVDKVPGCKGNNCAYRVFNLVIVMFYEAVRRPFKQAARLWSLQRSTCL
jgi:hypothetical protein